MLMREAKWLGGITLLFLVMFAGLFVACQNEKDDNVWSTTGLDVGVELLKLSDNNTNIAGQLEIYTDESEIDIKWNTDSVCNIDTTQSKFSVKNGICTLPIKWKEKLSDDQYGPIGVAYKAGIQITAGKYTKYVPLIWAEKIDTMKVMESIPQTRSASDPMPKVTQITMVPSTVNMNDELGGSMYVGLSNVAFAVFDWSEFTTDKNIDMSKLPNSIQTSTMLDFKWKASGPPAFEFSAKVIAMSEGLTQIGIVQYVNTTVPSSSLEVTPSSHTIDPAGQTVYSSVTSNTNWTASSNVAWINPVVVSNTQLSFIVAQNTTGVTRTGAVTVTAGNVSRTVSFTQPGKSSFQGTVANCSNIRITGGGRWITAIDAVYGEYTAITAVFNNVQTVGSKFIKNADGTVTIQPGTYCVKFNGNFNVGSTAAGGAIYLASARDLYFRAFTPPVPILPISSYFKWHSANSGGAIMVDAFSSAGATVTISSATTIRCDAQIVGSNRPWGWTYGWLTISSMEITEL